MYKSHEKGSPAGYDAETGYEEPAQKPDRGEPHERHSLYRIRCPQEKHQLLRQWAEAQRQPWRGALEAKLFSGWIYDTLKPYGQQLDMAHPAMLKAVTASKKKNDEIDPLFPQMDVWPRCGVGPAQRSKTARNDNPYDHHPARNPSAQYRRSFVFP